MKINKYLKILIILIMILLIFLINGIVVKDNDINFIDDKAILEKTSNFTISMWIKPVNNSYYQTILRLYDNKIDNYIYNNTEDKDFLPRGITLSNDYEEIYCNNNYKLSTGHWSNLTVSLKSKRLKVYLDGIKFIDKKITSSLREGKIKLELSNSFEYSNIKYYNYVIDDDTIMKNFENEIEYKFKGVEFNNIYPEKEGEYYLNNTPFKVSYLSESEGLIFNRNSFTLKENNSDNEKKHRVLISIELNNKKYHKYTTLKQKANNNKTIFEHKLNKTYNSFKYYMSTNDTILNDDIDYVCDVIEGNAYFDNINKQFVKTKGSKERESILIKCTVNYDNYTESFTKRILLLDDYKGYLMVFFSGDAPEDWEDFQIGNEQLYFAYSEDLKCWDIISRQAIITTEKGSGRFRDPYIDRDKDGNFVITSTEAYYNQGIYITRSENLSKFDTETICFNVHDPLLKLKGNITWAPEFVYNDKKDSYTIVFSEGNSENKGIYAVDTKDFQEFSYPYVYFQNNRNSIDPDIVMINGEYYIFYKDEEVNKDVYYATADCIDNPVWIINDTRGFSDGIDVEGPFTIKDYKSNKYYLYLDGYVVGKILSGEIQTINNKLVGNIDEDNDLTKQSLNIRHFSIVPITNAEYNNIIQYRKK